MWIHSACVRQFKVLVSSAFVGWCLTAALPAQAAP